MGAIQVFFRNEKLPTVAAWNEAIKAEGFDLVLDPFDPRTEDCYRSAILNGQETAFEWFLNRVADLEEDDYYKFKSQIGDCDMRGDFGAGSPEDEEVASKIAGAVLAKITNGFYLDAEAPGLVFHQGLAAIAIARKATQEWEGRVNE
jgi:hypothetical protein